MKMIKVSEKTWKKLMYLKIEKGFASMDETINYLLQRGEQK